MTDGIFIVGCHFSKSTVSLKRTEYGIIAETAIAVALGKYLALNGTTECM